MAVQHPCLDAASLKHLLNKGGTDQDVEQLEQHLSSCPRCGDVVESVLAADPISVGLRGLSFAKDDSGLQSLQSRLARLRPQAGFVDTRREVFGQSETLIPGPTSAPPPLARTAAFPFLAAPQKPDELGRLANYRILKELGRGGMGLVFRAEDALLGRKVALKVMLPEVARTENVRARFLREAQAMAALEHPHVVTIFQVGEESGVPFFAMPLLKGESLATRLEREPRLPPFEAARIAVEMAAGLAAAHAAKLIHRDIKPGNCWLEGELARVRLLDFGLVHAETASPLSGSGLILGTPEYMSPEQWQSNRVDARTDLFSLGVVLYLMLTGTKPFPGETLGQILAKTLQVTPPAPHQIVAEVPRALSDYTTRLLAKNREDRPGSAQEVVDELRRIVRAAIRKAPPEPVTPALPRKPRRRVAVLVAGFLAASVLVAGIIIIIRDKSGKQVAEVKVPDDSDVKIVDTRKGTEITIQPKPEEKVKEKEKPAPQPDPTSKELRVGARVTVTANTGGYEDDTTDTGFHSVPKGSKGELLKLAKLKNRCLIRLDGPAKLEKWVRLDLVIVE